MKLWLAGALVFSVFFAMVSCTTPSKRGVASDSNSSELENQLLPLFAKRIFSLDRDLIGFRYESQEFSPQSMTDIQTHMQAWPKRFFDPKAATGDQVGPGTYLAIDPAASRTFGNANPQLFVVTLRKATVMLNIESKLDPVDSESFKKIFDQQYCGDMTSHTLKDIFGILRNSTMPECRQAIINVLRTLHVQAILYGWVASNTLNQCRTNRATAVNLISADAIDWGKVGYYTDQKIIESTPMADQVAALYNEAMRDFEIQFAQKMEDIRPLHTLMNRSDVDTSLMKKNIADCGPEWSFEKQHQVSPLHMPRNVDLTQAITKAKRAFVTKSLNEGTDFTIFRLRKFEDLIYSRFSKLISKENFLVAKDLIENRRDDNRASDLLNEKKQTPQRDNKTLEDLENRHGGDLSYLYNYSRIANGWEPRAAEINTDYMLSWMGYAPIVIGKVPTQNGVRTAEDNKKNDEAYMPIWKSCLREYQDPQRSFEEIQKGSCGIRENGARQ